MLSPKEMDTHTAPRAVAALFFSATLWGLSWWPLKQFAAQGLGGPMLSLWSYGPAGLCGIALLWWQSRAWRGQGTRVMWLGLVGGWANVAFISALMLGEVVRVMLLFYLSPVWAVLGGYLFLGERLGRRRLLAVGLALGGLWFVLGGAHAWMSTLQLADWLALSSGLAFAGNNLIARATPSVPPLSKAMAVFLGGGLVAALVVVLQPGSPSGIATATTLGAGTLLALLLYGFVWLGLAMLTWQYGVTHLEAGRAAVILITELVVAVASALLFGDEQLRPGLVPGALLIGFAALLEATDAGEPIPPADKEFAKGSP